MSQAWNTDRRPSDAPRLEAILEAAVAAIITIDERGAIQHANRAVRKIFGYEPEQLLGRNVSVLMPSPYAEEHDRYLSRYLETGEARIIGIGRNVRGKRADGTTFPMHLAVGEFRTNGERGFTGIVHDESALELSRQRLEQAIGSLSEGFALYDAADRLVLCNERFSIFYGLPADLVRPGTLFADQLRHIAAAGAEDEDTEALIAERLQARAAGAVEFRQQLADGRWLLVRERRTENGDMVGTSTDVTEIVEKDAALQRAARLRALGELTGGVAHDFNNLLAVVVGNLELLEDRLDAEERTMVREALDAADIGSRLTERLLAFARRQTLASEPLDVNELVLEIVAILQRTLGEAIDLSLDLTPRLPPIVADRSQLETGLVNLAANARDAMRSGGRLVIETALAEFDGEEIELPAGYFARLSVTDTGCGMPPEVRERVFEPFFTTKEKGSSGGGAGLGLSSLYGFARQSGGTVTVYSEPGKGSTFNLYLPVTDVPKPRGRDDAETAGGTLAGRTVLVVEDDERVRRTSTRRVEALGARVFEAGDASQALRCLEENKSVDIVFTDLVMPGGMDGYELARRVAVDYPRTAVLLTSGYAEDRLNAQQLQSLRLKLLRKPYRQADLAAALTETLALPR